MISTSDYRKCIELLPILTVDLLIFNKEKTEVMLFKRKNAPLQGEFYSLGGRLHKGEKIEDAILRKAKEEAGLDLKYDDLEFGRFANEMFEDSVYEGVSSHTPNLFFAYIYNDEGVILDAQHDEFKWFKVDDESLHFFLQQKIKYFL